LHAERGRFDFNPKKGTLAGIVATSMSYELIKKYLSLRSTVEKG
jgi:hypothetical protein